MLSGTTAAHELLVRLPYLTAVPAPDPDNGALLQRQALALATGTAEAYDAIGQVKYGERPQNVKANHALVWRARGAVGGSCTVSAGTG